MDGCSSIRLKNLMANELRKERLTFVSGTILVWGVLLVRLWPSVASFQSGRHIHMWTANLPGQGVLPGLWIFWILTGLLSLGALAVALAVIYILSYGLAIAETEPQSATVVSSFQAALERLCSNTYLVVFIQWFIVLVILGLAILVLLSAGLEQFLGRFLAVAWTRWISRTSVFLIVFLFYLIFRKRLANLFRYVQEQTSFTRAMYFVAASGFMLSWVVTIEFCNTVALTVDTKIVRHDQGTAITVELGGSTSDPREATLQIIDAKGAMIQTLAFNEVNEGTYLAYITPTSVTPGFYYIVLKYPHPSMSSSFPYVRGVTVRSQGLLVAP